MKTLYQGCMLLALISIVTGILYPLLIMGIGQAVFPKQSNGSLIKEGNIVRGSMLVGQPFSGKQYFWPRPSASQWGAVPSSASNLGPTSNTLKIQIQKRRQELASLHFAKEQEIPPDLLTTSASGLDPHISVASAWFQMDRISKARQLNEAGKEKLKILIKQHIEQRQLGMLGEKRVNVFLLNWALYREMDGVK